MFALRRQLAVNWPMWLTAVLITGNLTSSRSFAHLGVSPLFIGEVALGSFLFWRFRVYVLRWLQPLFTPGPFSGWAWSVLIFLYYGVLQAVRGVMCHDAKLTALMCFAFHLYPLFFFVGVDVGLRQPSFLRQLLRCFAWLHGVYGLLYILALSPLGLSDAVDTGWGVFSQPYGGAIAMLGILCFEQLNLRRLIPLLLNFFVLIGVQMRAEWLGFSLSFAAWTLLTGRMKQLAKLATVCVLLALAGIMTDFKVPAPAGRGGEISVRGIVGRSLTAVSPELASGLIDDPERYASTVSWRTSWWTEIVALVHESPVTAMCGLGYGFPIWEYHPEGVERELRTPHSIVIHTLGYTGWCGLFVYGLMQLAMAVLLWKTFRLTGQPFGIVCWLLISVWATADNLVEAPYGAIPFYLLLGLATAPLLQHQRRSA